MNSLVTVLHTGRLARIALNRPEKRNALSTELCRELVQELEAADADTATGAVLLTGLGRHFCAGMDLDEVLETETGAIDQVHEQLFTFAARLTTPVIAAVQGAALAGGTGLVANCHVVVAEEGATFGLTEIRLGLWPFVIFRAVTAAVGERRAVELALTGRTFDAHQAAGLGLVHQVVPAAELETRAEQVAEAIAASSYSAVKAGLRFVREARGVPWDEAGRIAGRMRSEVFQTDDFREGVRAFREKRKQPGHYMLGSIPTDPSNE
jgi:enoyl-CoA hydratase/carnithine racemase